jgi:hypothetical protein
MTMKLEDELQAGDPAQAFEDLRTEVAAMRRAVEALPGAWDENRPPDYSLDLGRIAKGLAAVTGQLDTINKHPALRLTPEQHSQAVAQAGYGLMREAAQKLDRATQNAERERQDLASLIGTVRTKRDQLLWVVALPVMVFAVTLFASPLLLSWLPFGLPSQAAVLIMNDDRWDAGLELLREASPASYEKMTSLYTTCGQQTLEFCTEAITAKTISSAKPAGKAPAKSRRERRP